MELLLVAAPWVSAQQLVGDLPAAAAQPAEGPLAFEHQPAVVQQVLVARLVEDPLV